MMPNELEHYRYNGKTIDELTRDAMLYETVPADVFFWMVNCLRQAVTEKERAKRLKGSV